ncbi:hypothetical protein PG996_004194 [Apiospora saccharicola]|uniref:DEK C-terminal domain-containing protein n=1 Tax=Apiospora saccharicola TaxID=335842 RepID=A0ABR1W3F5_9PEZI
MPAKKTTNGAASVEENSISSSEMEYVTTFLKCMTPAQKPQLSAAGVQALCDQFDLKDKKTVMQRFNRICDKYGWFKAEPAAGEEGPSTPGGGGGAPKKKAGGGRKRKTGATSMPANVEDGDDAEAEPSPARKRKIQEEV